MTCGPTISANQDPFVVKVQSATLTVRTTTPAPAVVKVSHVSPFSITISQSDPIIFKVGVQGPAGPPGPPGPAGFPPIVAETDDSLVPGSPVYVKNNAHFGLAQGDAFPQSRFAGFSRTTTAPTFAAEVISGGPLELTTAEWDAITGQVGGLTPGIPYFLSTAVAGRITTVPPSSLFSVKVGKAVTPTTLDVDPRNPIKL